MLIEGREAASSRLRAYLIGDVLQHQGHEVLYDPPAVTPVDAAVFVKWGDQETFAAWRAAGAKVVFDMPDYWPHQVPLAAHADAVTVNTPGVFDLYRDRNPVLIPDALDVTPASPLKTGQAPDVLSVCWYGGWYSIENAAMVGRACQALGLTFVMITGFPADIPAPSYPVEIVPWSLETIDQAITACDVAACPSARPHASPNRPLKAWALGMPVAGTPIRSYVEVGLRHQATTLDEWITALETLRDPALRQADADAGWITTRAFRAEVLAERWLEVLTR